MNEYTPDLAQARKLFLAGGDEAQLPIVDAHHHYWDVENNRHPWLQDTPRIPFRYGDYAPICRNWLPADHARAAQHHKLVRSVVMEGEFDPHNPLGESLWMQELARREGTPHAFCAQIGLDRDDVGEVLAACQNIPLIRAVRHKPRSTTRAAWRSDYAASGSMRCPRWRAGFARLQHTGLRFELQIPWWHAPEAVELARDFPAIAIVINHALLPAQRDAESLACWARAVQSLADCPNVWMKISGIGVPGQEWATALQQPVVHALLEIFGVQRCLFASNFPVDGLTARFDQIYAGFKSLTRHLNPADRLALFCDNACRLYRLQ